MPVEHSDFLMKAHPYLEQGDRVFVHGGFDPDRPLNTQDLHVLAWDRVLMRRAREEEKAGRSHPIGCYKEIFLGHTPFGSSQGNAPLHACNVWDLDTGAGWGGRLTIMDVNTKEYWQSDTTRELYGVNGRQQCTG